MHLNFFNYTLQLMYEPMIQQNNYQMQIFKKVIDNNNTFKFFTSCPLWMTSIYA